MPRRLSLQPHLAVEMLERRYRVASDPVARSHWQVIWLLARGMASAQVAAATGYTINWVRTVARRYNHHGPVGLEDRPHRNAGRVGWNALASLPRLAAEPLGRSCSRGAPRSQE